jgi:hypothetical protein
MRPLSLIIALAAIITGFGYESASAQVADQAAIDAARRDLAAAKLEVQQVTQLDFQCRRRELNAAIRVSDEEIRTLRRDLRRYGPFHAFAYGQQPTFQYRNLRLCIAEADASRRLLIAERNDLNRAYNNELALLNLNVSEARARLVELSGGGTIELDVVTADRPNSP